MVGLSAVLTVAAAAALQANVASHIVLVRNPDYGAIRPQDVQTAQQCKDRFLARVRETAERLYRGRVDLNAAEYDAAVIVAAAIELCLAHSTEGLHAIPSAVPLGSPLLR